MSVATSIAGRLRTYAEKATNPAVGQDFTSMAIALEAEQLDAATVPMGTSWASESVMTIVLTAAAEAAYAEAAPEGSPPWEALDPAAKFHMRQTLLAPTLAVLAALPDLRREAWLEGYAEGSAEMDAGAPADGSADCPYPAPELKPL